MVACIIIPVCPYPPLLFFFRATSRRHHPRDIHCPTSVVLYSMYHYSRRCTPFRLYNMFHISWQKSIMPHVATTRVSIKSESDQSGQAARANQNPVKQTNRITPVKQRRIRLSVPKAAIMPITPPSKPSKPSHKSETKSSRRPGNQAD